MHEPEAADPKGGAGAQFQCSDLLSEAARLAALPTFNKAVSEYMIHAAQFRKGPRLVNKLISYEKRWRVVGFLLHLALDCEQYGPRGGATYKNLLKLCTERLDISPRVLKTVLALLRLSGHIETCRNEADGRSKYYRPTSKIFVFVHRWLSFAVSTLDVLEPDRQRTRLLQDDPGLAERFIVHGGRARLKEEPMVNLMPDYIAFFGRREGATAVLLEVMRADLEARAMPSQGEIARRFHLSKSQVNTIFVDGEAAGFFKTAAGVVRPTAYLVESHRRWIAIELAFYSQHLRPASEMESEFTSDEAAWP